MEEPGTEPRWLSVAEAARALGVTEHAVRRRIKRGTLEVRRETVGNHVRTLVAVPVRNEDQNRVVNTEVRAAVAEALVVELRGELAEVKEREQRLLALVERLTAERPPARRPWPGLKALWRRVWEGQG